MKDEEFEKILDKIDIIIEYDENGYQLPYVERRQRVRKILEEIYQKGYNDAKSEKWKVTYYKETFR